MLCPSTNHFPKIVPVTCLNGIPHTHTLCDCRCRCLVAASAEPSRGIREQISLLRSFESEQSPKSCRVDWYRSAPISEDLVVTTVVITSLSLIMPTAMLILMAYTGISTLCSSLPIKRHVQLRARHRKPPTEQHVRDVVGAIVWYAMIVGTVLLQMVLNVVVAWGFRRAGTAAQSATCAGSAGKSRLRKNVSATY